MRRRLEMKQKKEEKEEIALRMLEKAKLPIEEIAEYSDLTIEEVEKIALRNHKSIYFSIQIENKM